MVMELDRLPDPLSMGRIQAGNLSAYGVCRTLKKRETLTDMAASEKAVERWAALESNPEVLPFLITVP